MRNHLLLFLCLGCVMAIGIGCDPRNPTDRQEAVILGEPGCHGGGCPDASTPCKECGADGWCWCSTCCVALSERPSGWKVRDELAKEKARALAKKQGLSTEQTK
jgi:hypothetical protein